MLKSFINAKTGEKIRLSKWEHDKSKLEEELWMEVKWDWPFVEQKKRGRPKKEEPLDSNSNE